MRSGSRPRGGIPQNPPSGSTHRLRAIRPWSSWCARPPEQSGAPGSRAGRPCGESGSPSDVMTKVAGHPSPAAADVVGEISKKSIGARRKDPAEGRRPGSAWRCRRCHPRSRASSGSIPRSRARWSPRWKAEARGAGGSGAGRRHPRGRPQADRNLREGGRGPQHRPAPPAARDQRIGNALRNGAAALTAYARRQTGGTNPGIGVSPYSRGLRSTCGLHSNPARRPHRFGGHACDTRHPVPRRP
jgi:hypothetical protein